LITDWSSADEYKRHWPHSTAAADDYKLQIARNAEIFKKREETERAKAAAAAASKAERKQEKLRRIIDWRTPEPSRKHTVPAFAGQSADDAPTDPVDDAERFSAARDFFNLFIDNDVITRLVDSTNRRGNMDAPDGWTATKDLEMSAFIGTIIRMSMVRMKRIEHYWKRGVKGISDVWSRDRFMELWRCLNGSPDATADQRLNDRFWSVRWFVDCLNDRFARRIVPGQYLCVDETMIKFRGRHLSIQKMPKKPIRCGFKCWTLGTPWGYTINQTLYAGAKGTGPEEGLAANVVKRLVGPYMGQWRTVIMDKYFTTVRLFRDLSEQKTVAHGTFNTGRASYPIALKQWGGNAAANEFVVRECVQSPGLLAIAYRTPERTTHYLTTATPLPVPIKWMRCGRGDDRFPGPVTREEYNQTAGGVDLANQLNANTTLWHRAKRWWLCIFLHFLNVAIVNAYLMYRYYGASDLDDLTFDEFRIQLADQLIDDARFRQTRGRPRKAPRTAHEQRVNIETDSRNWAVRKACSVCFHTGGRRGNQRQTGAKTAYMCVNCNVFVCDQRLEDRNCWAKHIQS
jgi:hypothetical protein